MKNLNWFHLIGFVRIVFGVYSEEEELNSSVCVCLDEGGGDWSVPLLYSIWSVPVL